MVGKREAFGTVLSFRLFEEEAKKMDKVVKYAKDFDGLPKYENFSHFCRCAVIRALRDDYKEIENDRGRPGKKRIIGDSFD